MSKCRYDKKQIEDFVKNLINKDITINPVKEGMESQVYSFVANDKNYIIRINPLVEGFYKDKYAYDHFSNENIIIPKVYDIGKFDNVYYCISEKSDGITYEDSSEETVDYLLPEITKIKDSIENIDISNTNGYGIFDSSNGNAPYNSWKEYMLKLNDINWEEVKSKDYVDNNLIDTLLNTYNELICYLPDERKLYHGDFGNNNILVSDNKFSGVIDWDCAGYGDSLCTVGSAYFWSKHLMCADHV